MSVFKLCQINYKINPLLKDTTNLNLKSVVNKGFSVFQKGELLKLVLIFWLDLTEAPHS